MIHAAWLLLVPLAGLLGIVAGAFLRNLTPCAICTERPAAYCGDCVRRAASYAKPTEQQKGGLL